MVTMIYKDNSLVHRLECIGHLKSIKLKFSEICYQNMIGITWKVRFFHFELYLMESTRACDKWPENPLTTAKVLKFPHRSSGVARIFPEGHPGHLKAIRRPPQGVRGCHGTIHFFLEKFRKIEHILKEFLNYFKKLF